VTEVELQADLEHQQDQSDLAEDGHRFSRDGAEHIRKDVRRKQAEQRGAEQQSDDNLAHYTRLRQPHGDFPAKPRQDHDQTKLQQREEQQQFGLVHGRLHAIISP